MKNRRVIFIHILLLLCVALNGCGKSQSTEKLLAEARQYKQKGDNKAAIIQLKNALQKDPENKDARFLLGEIYNDFGDPVSAEKEVRKAISLGIPPTVALPALTKALLSQNQFQKVLDELGTDARSTTEPEMMILRGNAFLGLEKKLEAKDSFESILKLRPDFAPALLGLARVAIAERNIGDANRFTEQAVLKNPTNAEAWLFKGDLLRVQGDQDGALKAYAETTRIDPTNSAALLVKANLEIGMKKFAEAKADIDAAKKLATNQVLALYSQALLEYGQNNFKASLESLQQVEKYAPDFMPAVLLSGAVQFSLGSTKQAEQYLRKYLDSNPRNIYAKKLLVGTLLKTSQAEQAITVLEPILKAGSDDSQIYALAGDAYLKLKNFNKATEYYEKANTLSPNTAEYHTALGLSKVGQGNSASAIAELEKASDLDPKSTRAGILLIMTQLKLKEYDKALAIAKATEKEQPDNPLIHNLKGGIYLTKKDMANARVSFEKAVSLQANYFPAIANLARLDVQEKKPDVAKKRLEAALEKDKKNVQLITALANLAVFQKNDTEARVWYERAANENPDSLQAAQLLAQHYLKIAEKDKALVFTKKAQASNPTSPGFMELLARVQLSVSDKAGALESYTKFAAMQPESAPAQFKVASTLMSMGNETEAIDALKKTLRIDAKFLDAQLALSTIYAKKGNFDEALILSRQIQTQYEKSPLGFVQEGDIFLLQKKNAQAIQSYERALKLAKFGQIVTKLHNAMILDGKTKDADARINLWLKENPKDNATKMYFGMYLLSTESNKKAGIDQLTQILNTEPENVVVLNNLAWALGEAKDKKAIDYAEKANKIAPNNAAIMDTLGWIMVEQGDTAKGAAIIKQALQIAPESLDIRYHNAVAMFKLGDKDKARKEFEQILAKDSNYSKANEIKALLK